MSEGLGSAFPHPPQHYEIFTETNVSAVKAVEKNEEVPLELRFLIPPKVPEDSSYRSFGDTWLVGNELPTLEQAGIPRLYEVKEDGSFDRVAALQTLAKSLLLNYVELVGVLGLVPERFPEKVEHIRIILINMHHLINEYRPHQARETLISMMQEQLVEQKTKLTDAEQACTKARDIIERFMSTLRAMDDQAMQKQDSSQTRDLKIWDAINNRLKKLNTTGGTSEGGQ